MMSKKYKPFRITRIFREIGFDRKRFINIFLYFGRFVSQYRKLKKQKAKDDTFYFGSLYPIISDYNDSSGVMSGHYFQQDLYVARKIFENNPSNHLDIGSRTDGFVAHVAVFRQIDIIDIREQVSTVKNINFRKADLMKLPEDIIESYESVSSLHAIEHFGLGRYGDPIDYQGYKKAIDNVTQILRVGGNFYFSVPIGSQRIEFNAHRVFSVQYLINLLSKYYSLDSFAYVDDEGDLFENVDWNSTEAENNFGCNFGCGIFELTKL